MQNADFEVNMQNQAHKFHYSFLLFIIHIQYSKPLVFSFHFQA